MNRPYWLRFSFLIFLLSILGSLHFILSFLSLWFNCEGLSKEVAFFSKWLFFPPSLVFFLCLYVTSFLAITSTYQPKMKEKGPSWIKCVAFWGSKMLRPRKTNRRKSYNRKIISFNRNYCEVDSRQLSMSGNQPRVGHSLCKVVTCLKETQKESRISKLLFGDPL